MADENEEKEFFFPERPTRSDVVGYPPEKLPKKDQSKHQDIYVDSDILNDNDRGSVPLFTDLSKIPRHKGKYENKNTDSARYNEFEWKEEAKTLKILKIDESRMTRVRTCKEANEVCKEMIGKINEYDGPILCGFDTERMGCTFQTSIRIHNAE